MQVNILILLFLLLLLSGCSSVKFDKPTRIYLNGDKLVYQGQINSENANKAILLIQNSAARVNAIVINSKGGSIRNGLKLGYFIALNNLDLIVDGVCASSCANYLLTAAKNKIIKADSIIGFHGSALQQVWGGNEKNPLYCSHLIIQRLQEIDFYNSINVNPFIGVFGQFLDPEDNRNNDPLWTYTNQTFKLLGVNDVVYEGDYIVEPYNYLLDVPLSLLTKLSLKPDLLYEYVYNCESQSSKSLH